MRLIDADKLLTKTQDYGEGQEKLILIDPYYVKNAKTVQAIPIPDNATNGDVIKAIFPNVYSEECDYDIFITLDGDTRFTYDWWNAPYKRGGENADTI